MFKRKTISEINDKAVEIILKENERLKRENLRLQESLDELSDYKTEYKKLIEQVSDLKKQYCDKLSEFDLITRTYQDELDKIVVGKQ